MINIGMDSTWATLAGRLVSDGFLSILDETAKVAQENAPLQSGELRSSIESFIAGGLTGGIVAHAPHASFVHEGTGVYGPTGRAYAIRPRKRKALYWPGGRHPVRSVTHPGQRANPFLFDAVFQADINAALQKTIDK